jgi:hypothetical protein
MTILFSVIPGLIRDLPHSHPGPDPGSEKEILNQVQNDGGEGSEQREEGQNDGRDITA